jgi:hypothetical protein
MRLANVRLQIVLRQCGFDARLEIAAICLVVRVLELASATFGEVAARRLLVVRPRRERSVVEQRIAGDSECDVATA